MGGREYVLDSEFRWAQDDYNSTQRSIEIWAFIIRLRSWLFLIDKKWSYVGGFTEEKYRPPHPSEKHGLLSWSP